MQVVMICMQATADDQQEAKWTCYYVHLDCRIVAMFRIRRFINKSQTYNNPRANETRIVFLEFMLIGSRY